MCKLLVFFYNSEFMKVIQIVIFFLCTSLDTHKWKSMWDVEINNCYKANPTITIQQNFVQYCNLNKKLFFVAPPWLIERSISFWNNFDTLQRKMITQDVIALTVEHSIARTIVGNRNWYLLRCWYETTPNYTVTIYWSCSDYSFLSTI